MVDRPGEQAPAETGGAVSASRPRPAPARARPRPVRPTDDDLPTEGEAESKFTEIQVAGEHWVVHVAGASLAGESSGSVAPLLLLTFARAGEAEHPTSEVMVAGRTLSDLSDLQLENAFRQARPHEPEWSGRPIFGATRRGKGRR